ncbi:MAG TPA: hypothetical protein VNI54_02830 [Thermoanaerobaculia bacterium]|nr:hypothetical protein [Thermoanaerobaculia bacterium]
MKVYSRRAAAVALAVFLSGSVSAFAGPRERAPRERDLSKLVKIIKKFVGIGTFDDLPLPPPPKPS